MIPAVSIKRCRKRVLRCATAAGDPGRRGIDNGPLPPLHNAAIIMGDSYGTYHRYGEQWAACLSCVAAAMQQAAATVSS